QISNRSADRDAGELLGDAASDRQILSDPVLNILHMFGAVGTVQGHHVARGRLDAPPALAGAGVPAIETGALQRIAHRRHVLVAPMSLLGAAWLVHRNVSQLSLAMSAATVTDPPWPCMMIRAGD